MRLRCLTIAIIAAFPFLSTAQVKDKVKFNAGIKAGFQAVTYSDPKFDIGGYKFNTNNIQSNKIGYAFSAFARVTKNKFYLQTEATFGITNHSFDFQDEKENTNENFIPNNTVYDLRTYCIQVPILFGYNIVERGRYGLSIFTGPRTKFILTSLSEQNFKHFKYGDLEEILNDKNYYWEIGLGIKISRVFLDITFDAGLNEVSSHIISHKDGRIFKSSRRDNILSFSVGVIL
ncbi:MAG: PorT family protein [Bacteroidaceae bacterium]|nr:PorT family protein [Bacteroidaceae bacterium]